MGFSIIVLSVNLVIIFSMKLPQDGILFKVSSQKMLNAKPLRMFDQQ
jgi:hypothetical protein